MSPEFSLGGSSTVYMNGSAVYYIRKNGQPGIVKTLRLTSSSYKMLIEEGYFSVGSNLIKF